jgi:hypothetical protein
MTTASDDWKAAWQPMIDAIGRDFDDKPPVFVADPIERSAIRRWLEPLEFDCALHCDPEVAREHGHADVVVPTSALSTFALAPMWRPGETLFTSAERNAPPAFSSVSGVKTGLEPTTTGYFATNIDYEYLRPAVAGDRLLKRGARLLACQPKETKVGRGAFITWGSELINQRQEVVVRMQATFFRYNPLPKP